MKRRTFIQALVAAIPFIPIAHRLGASQKPKPATVKEYGRRVSDHGDYPVWGLDGDGDIYEQWAPGEAVPDAILNRCLFIPDNDHDIWPGYWQEGAKVSLLRNLSERPRAIQFVADMME